MVIFGGAATPLIIEAVHSLNGPNFGCVTFSNIMFPATLATLCLGAVLAMLYRVVGLHSATIEQQRELQRHLLCITGRSQLYHAVGYGGPSLESYVKLLKERLESDPASLPRLCGLKIFPSYYYAALGMSTTTLVGLVTYAFTQLK